MSHELIFTFHTLSPPSWRRHAISFWCAGTLWGFRGSPQPACASPPPPTPHFPPPSKQNNCVHPLTFIIGAEELLVAWRWLPDGKQKPPPSWIDVWVSFCQTVQCKTYAGILHSSAAFDYLLNVIIMWKQQICAPTQNLGLGPFIKNKKMLFMTPHKTWPWSEASCSLVAHPPVRSRWKYYIKYIYIDHLFFNCACLSLE